MKRIVTLAIAAGMLFAAATGAQAIEFNARGQWFMGFAVGDGSLVSHTTANGEKTKANNIDKFSAAQRIRLFLDAKASENLSGTVAFELGTSTWGKTGASGALGADDTCIKLKHAYIDWTVPDTELSVRMGIQALVTPYVAGGSAILDDDVAAVVASYKFSENVALTATWMRPFNDNYTAVEGEDANKNKTAFVDNMDLIALALDLNFDGFKVTPWAMYGLIGQNTSSNLDSYYAMFMYANYDSDRFGGNGMERRKGSYINAFWAGIPFAITLWDPLNIEVDLNYGFTESWGKGWLNDGAKRYDTRSEGWLAKALVEYKMDWGTPGIFGWYASGDDSNPKNGSERMPTISACGSFTSFMGDGNLAWTSGSGMIDRELSYSGTWGIGIQIADMSFIENLSHTFRAAYWGGTNSPSMAKYASVASAWGYAEDGSGYDDLYLTTNDGLLEFNLVNTYQMYENFEINLELGYIVNFMDHDTWEKADANTGFKKQDAWKAQVVFAYTF